MRILQRISLWLQKQKERIARFFSFLRKKERTLPPKTKPAAQVPLDMLQEMGDFLRSRYHFRFNLLTETTEFRKIQAVGASRLGQRFVGERLSSLDAGDGGWLDGAGQMACE